MKKIVVRNQEQLDNIPVDYDGRIIIKFGTPYNRAIVNRAFKYSVVAWGNSSVVAWGNSSVEARGNSSVVAWENSSVVAWENSSVEAWENSSVEAWGNSSVVARENSSVVAWGNSSVEAWENSSVVAWGNSSVEAWGNSSVEAWENSQITDRQNNGTITTNGNARVVFDPKTIDEYLAAHNLDAEGKTCLLYKAVHKRDGKYVADYDSSFVYSPGEVSVSEFFEWDPKIECGCGIHMAHKEWAVDFGRSWNDLAIIELEAEKDDIVVPLYGVGKVRAKKAKMTREVPLNECGLMGKILARKKNNN